MRPLVYALDTGDTQPLTDATTEPSNVGFDGPVGWVFIEVDAKTGIAYTVELGEPLTVDELVGR